MAGRIVTLRDLWLERVARHKKKAGLKVMSWAIRANFFVNYWLLIVAGGGVLLLMLVAAVTGTSPDGGIDWQSTAMFAGALAAGLLMRHWRRSLDAVGRAAVASNPAATEAPLGWSSLEAEAAALAQTLGIDELALAPTTASKIRTPYATASQGKTIVAVPVNFLMWRQREPVASRGILAHELAHVVQEDPIVWRRSLVGAKIGIVSVLILLSVAVAEVLYKLLFAPDYRVTPTGLFWIVVIVFYYRIRIYRHQSEYLADLGAAVATDVDTVRAAIGQIQVQSFAARLLRPATHPSPQKRLKRLEAAVRAVQPG